MAMAQPFGFEFLCCIGFCVDGKDAGSLVLTVSRADVVLAMFSVVLRWAVARHLVANVFAFAPVDAVLVAKRRNFRSMQASHL